MKAFDFAARRLLAHCHVVLPMDMMMATWLRLVLIRVRERER